MTSRVMTKEEFEEIKKCIDEIKANERTEANKLIEYYDSLPAEEYGRLAAKVVDLLCEFVTEASKEDVIDMFIDITCAYQENDASNMFKSFTGGYLLQDVLELALLEKKKGNR